MTELVTRLSTTAAKVPDLFLLQIHVSPVSIESPVQFDNKCLCIHLLLQLSQAQSDVARAHRDTQDAQNQLVAAENQHAEQMSDCETKWKARVNQLQQDLLSCHRDADSLEQRASHDRAAAERAQMQVTAARDEVQSLTVNVQHLEQRLADTKKEHAGECERLVATFEEMKQKLPDPAALVQAESQITTLTSVCRDKDTDLMVQSSCLDALEEKCAGMSNELTQTRHQAEASQAKVEQLSQLNEELEIAHRQAVAALELSQNEVERLRDKCGQERDRRALSVAQKSTSDKHVSTLEVQNRALQLQCQKLKDEAMRQQDLTTRRLDALEEAAANVAEQGTQLKDPKDSAEIQRLQLVIVNLETELRVKEIALTKLDSKRSKEEHDNKVYKGDVSNLRRQVKGLKQSLHQKDSELKKMQEAVEFMGGKMEVVGSKTVESAKLLGAQLQGASESNSRLSERCSALEDHSRAAVKDLALATAHLEEANKKTSELESHNKQLTNQLAAANATLEDYSKTLEWRQAQLQEVQKDFETAREALRSMNSASATLCSKIAQHKHSSLPVLTLEHVEQPTPDARSRRSSALSMCSVASNESLYEIESLRKKLSEQTQIAACERQARVEVIEAAEAFAADLSVGPGKLGKTSASGPQYPEVIADEPTSNGTKLQHQLHRAMQDCQEQARLLSAKQQELRLLEDALAEKTKLCTTQQSMLQTAQEKNQLLNQALELQKPGIASAEPSGTEQVAVEQLQEENKLLLKELQRLKKELLTLREHREWRHSGDLHHASPIKRKEKNAGNAEVEHLMMQSQVLEEENARLRQQNEELMAQDFKQQEYCEQSARDQATADCYRLEAESLQQQLEKVQNQLNAVPTAEPDSFKDREIMEQSVQLHRSADLAASLKIEVDRLKAQNDQLKQMYSNASAEQAERARQLEDALEDKDKALNKRKHENLRLSEKIDEMEKESVASAGTEKSKRKVGGLAKQRNDITRLQAQNEHLMRELAAYKWPKGSIYSDPELLQVSICMIRTIFECVSPEWAFARIYFQQWHCILAV